MCSSTLPQKTIKWVSSILFIEWGPHSLGRKRKKKKKAYNHMVIGCIFGAFCNSRISDFWGFTNPLRFLHTMFITMVCPYTSFSTFFASLRYCFHLPPDWNLLGQKVSACKYGWQLEYKQYHNTCNNDNLSYNFKPQKDTALGEGWKKVHS